MIQSRRQFLRFATALSGLSLTGWVTLRPGGASAAARAARRFLAGQQSADGAWRSSRYAAFREGDALTPLVLWAIGPNDPAFAGGRRWLETFTDSLPEHEPWSAAIYPLFTASYAAQVFAKIGDIERAKTWASIVEQLRISAALGWPADDPACGAWGDSATPPQRPAGLTTAPDMMAPNVSATLLGVQALVAVGKTEAATAARPFLEQCQNFAASAPGPFDDGGFFFAPADPIRNKAGTAGTDAAGHPRFRSYGSATCDGLIALIVGGASATDPHVTAAIAWLYDHARGPQHSGEWSPDRTRARESLNFYYAQSLADVLAHLSANAPSEWATRQQIQLTADLITQQQPDGSWSASAPDSDEDDAIVATVFALRAVAGSSFGQGLRQRG